MTHPANLKVSLPPAHCVSYLTFLRGKELPGVKQTNNYYELARYAAAKLVVRFRTIYLRELELRLQLAFQRRREQADLAEGEALVRRSAGPATRVARAGCVPPGLRIDARGGAHPQALLPPLPERGLDHAGRVRGAAVDQGRGDKVRMSVDVER